MHSIYIVRYMESLISVCSNIMFDIFRYRSEKKYLPEQPLICDLP